MNPLYIQGAPIPDSVGRTVDLYKEVSVLRLAMEKEAEAVKKRETELKESIINRLAKSRGEGGDTGAAGLRYRAEVKDEDVYSVRDWPSFHAWVLENERLDMLEKRVGKTAMADFVEHTRTLPPGVELVKVPTVSVTKL